MSAISRMFEATLGQATELSTEHELVHPSGGCGTVEPRGWVIDIGVRARIVDTSAGPVVRPGPSDFLEQGVFETRAPLHLRIEAGLFDGGRGSNRSWLLDATSTRAYLFASSITIYLVGPASLTPYDVPGELSKTGKRDVFVQLHAGLWPCDTRGHSTRLPSAPARGSNCSIRVRIPAGRTDVAVLIPAGARTLAIFDSSESSSPWTWQLGTDPSERSGRISMDGGQSIDTALVPNFSHVAPAAPLAVERDVLLVFGVDL